MPKEKIDSSGIALALGGGAARGLAHIGVLKVLEKNQIPIKAISGTSMGALVGGLYAAGIPAIELEQIARSIDWIKIIQILFPNQIKISGLLNSKSIYDFVFSIIGEKNIEKLDIPFYACATDLWSGESIILDSGSLAKAIEASSCFPFLFTPVQFKDLVLVDGGISNPLGLDILRQKSQYPIVCSVVTPSPHRRKKKIHHKSASRRSRFERFSQQFPSKHSPYLTNKLRTYLSKYQEWTMNRSLARPNLRKQVSQIGNIMEYNLVNLSIRLFQPEIVLRPDISEFTFFDFLDVDEIIRRGETEAEKSLKTIMTFLNGTSHILPSE